MRKFIRFFLKTINYFNNQSISSTENANEVVGLIIVCLSMTILQFLYCFSIGLIIDSLITLFMSVLYIVILILFKNGYIKTLTLGRIMILVSIVGIWAVNMDAGMGVNPSMVWLPAIPIFAIIATGASEGFLWSLASIILSYSSMQLAKIYDYNFNEFNQEQWFEVGSSNLITAPLLFYGIFAYFYHKKNKDIYIQSKFAQIGMDTSYLVHEIGKPIFRMKNSENINKQDIQKIIEIYSIVDDIRKGESNNISNVNLNSTIYEVLKDYDEYFHFIELQKVMPSESIYLRANNTAMEIITKNLILNAIEASSRTEKPIIKIFLKKNELLIENNHCPTQEDFEENAALLNSQKIGNLGVGLFLTKKLCRINNLELNLESISKGNIFRAYLKFSAIN